MKRVGLAVVSLLLFTRIGFSQVFNFPTVDNNVESIKAGFWALIENAKNLGIVEYKSDWTSSPESIVRHYTEYLDNVLANMTHDKVKAYAVTIRTNINRLDRQSISRNAELEFERFLTAAYPNYDHEVNSMLRNFLVRPFPASITLNYDKSQIENLDEQFRKNEKLVSEYRIQLEALPTHDSLQAQLQIVQDELRKPENQRNNQRSQQLKNDETRIMNQIANTNATRVNITQNIRNLENYLRNNETNRLRLISSLEQSARQAYINNAYENIYNFYSWEAFFNAENTSVRDFFILNNVQEHLYNLIDEIPQREAQKYRERLDDFCTGWGI
jgi:hypothetical protein